MHHKQLLSVCLAQIVVDVEDSWVDCLLLPCVDELGWW
jgi:hypothetical protein